LTVGSVDAAYEMAAPTHLNEAQDPRCIRLCDISSSCTLIYKVGCTMRRSLISRYLIHDIFFSALNLGERRRLYSAMMRNLQDHSLVIVGTFVWVIVPEDVVRVLNDYGRTTMTRAMKMAMMTTAEAWAPRGGRLRRLMNRMSRPVSLVVLES
jgi:hypothetical protein